MKVLIADDSALMRERLGALVAEIEGVELVGEAGSAKEALAGIRRLKPDVVILDIRMPGGNGIQVLQEIRKEPAARPIVIMLTAFPYPQYRQKCLEAGADYFFDKASEFDRVASLLKTLKVS
jgi:DNA-binding NarL/FixJ family response regulator